MIHSKCENVFAFGTRRWLTIKKVTVKDVALKSGYSVSTVSKALNGADRVGAKTIEKIKTIAAEMGYQSSFSAQSLKRGPRRVSIVMPREPKEVYRLFERGFTNAFDLYGEFGIEPVYFHYDLHRKGSLHALPWGQIEESDGVILIPGNENGDCAGNLERLGRRIPLVFLQSKHQELAQVPRLCDVTVHARVVGEMAAQFLGICTGGGQAALLTGDRRTWIHTENANGFLAAASYYGVEAVAVEECGDDLDRAYDVTASILRQYPRLKGIFATSYVAPAVCRCIEEQGREIQVAGVDLFAQSVDCLLRGSLSAAIFQNQVKQAELAVEAMIDFFRGAGARGDIIVKPELVLRSNLSCYGWL